MTKLHMWHHVNLNFVEAAFICIWIFPNSVKKSQFACPRGINLGNDNAPVSSAQAKISGHHWWLKGLHKIAEDQPSAKTSPGTQVTAYCLPPLCLPRAQASYAKDCLARQSSRHSPADVSCAEVSTRKEQSLNRNITGGIQSPRPHRSHG